MGTMRAESVHWDVSSSVHDSGGRSRPGAAFIRAVVAFSFVFATLAAGHLFMVAINALDHSINSDVYGREGMQAHWLGDRTAIAELGILQQRAPTEAARAHIAETIQAAQDGRPFIVHMLPVSPFLVGTAFALILAGLVLLLASRHLTNDAVQSVVGVFAGLMIWTGGVEYGLMIASRVLGVAKAFTLQGDRIVGAYGEYVLLKHTWGLILLVMIYLLFLEANRCPFFLWFRKRLRLMRGAIATGRIDNFAPRSAFQYITVMWMFYVLLLWAYDESVFGVDSWFTHAIFFGSFASTGYLLLRMFHQKSVGGAIRYAIGTAIICWNTVEIAAKWGLFREPWLILNPTTAVVFFGGAALGTWLVLHELRRNEVAVSC